jgi:molecular chaperone GrpE
MNNEYDDVTDGDIEVVPPENDETKAEEDSSTAIEKVTLALEQKTREAAEANNKYLRTYADFENYRKRMQRDLADFRKYANEQLALELLSVVDHLGLALKHASESSETEEANEGLRQGVELVYKQFRDTLEKFGVKSFNAEGELFDPTMHDAIMQVPTADAPENTVVQVFQEGYRYFDKILRHAKVGVAKSPPPIEEGPVCD